MNLRHRFATDADLDLLAAWNHQLIRDEGHRNPMTVRELRARMRRWLNTGDYRVVIFETDVEPLAYALYSEGVTDIYLRHLFVRRDRRRKCIGRRAITILRDHLWPRHKRLTVEVLTANAPAVAFWRAVGYRDYSLMLEILPQEKRPDGWTRSPTDVL